MLRTQNKQIYDLWYICVVCAPLCRYFTHQHILLYLNGCKSRKKHIFIMSFSLKIEILLCMLLHCSPPSVAAVPLEGVIKNEKGNLCQYSTYGWKCSCYIDFPWICQLKCHFVHFQPGTTCLKLYKSDIFFGMIYLSIAAIQPIQYFIYAHLH